MRKLMETKPILHAILWIVIYIAAVNAGDAASESTGISCLTGVLLTVLSAVLIFYVKKNRRVSYYGLTKMAEPDARRVLFYVPLIVLAFIQLAAGVPRTTTLADIAAACLLMIGTGFLEELIFRGFLFQGIYHRSGAARAILISGVTFGLGHIINLLRGYTSVGQAEQIVTAVVIGIVLAMLVTITRSIVPGILFHIVFNISGTVANAKSDEQTYLLIAILAIGASYAVYLIRFVPRRKDAEVSA